MPGRITTDAIIMCFKGSWSVGPVKAFYTSPTDRSVHSGIISTSLESILARQHVPVKTIHTHYFPQRSI